MAHRRKRPRRLDVDLREEIERWAGRLTGPQILERLSLDERYAARVPSLRTVQGVIAETRVPTIRTSDEVWTVATAGPGETEHVLPVLGCVIETTEGRVTQLRKDHAAWIARIRAAAPQLGEWQTYAEAARYVNAVNRRESTERLDARLARLAWQPISESESARGAAWARGEVDLANISEAARRGALNVPAAQVAEHRRSEVELIRSIDRKLRGGDQ